MSEVGLFIKNHLTLCILTAGLAIVGYLGYRAVKRIMHKGPLEMKVDEVAKNQLNAQTSMSESNKNKLHTESKETGTSALEENAEAKQAPQESGGFVVKNESTSYTISLEDQKADWFSISEKVQEGMLKKLKEHYTGTEASDQPPGGYQVHFKKSAGKPFTIVLDKIGSRNKGLTMPMPEEGKPCAFCPKVQAGEEMNGYQGLGQDREVRVIQSLSGNPLTIPDKHIPHFFAADSVMQKILIATAKEALKVFRPGTSDYDIHFHVGSAGAQTVPHLHTRIG